MYIFNHMVDETPYNQEKRMRAFSPFSFFACAKFTIAIMKELIIMFKKLLGGALLCCVLVPVSIVLSITDGVSLVLDCIGRGTRMVLKPLACKILELITSSTNNASRANKTISYKTMIES